MWFVLSSPNLFWQSNKLAEKLQKNKKNETKGIFMDIAKELSMEFSLTLSHTNNIISLLDEGCTIPFIARYRKELTGSCDDQTLRAFDDRLKYLRNLTKRKEEVSSLITEQGNMTEEIEKALSAALTLTEVEDIYRPFKPKRKTRASVAIAKGLQPLADKILEQKPFDLDKECELYISEEKGVANGKESLQGAKDIIAEMISDNANLRKELREALTNKGFVKCKLDEEKEGAFTYEMYKDYNSEIKKLPSHRILAINRGEKEDFLKVNLTLNDELAHSLVEGKVLKKNSPFEDLLKEVCLDSYDRLIFPSIEREVRAELTDKANEQAIKMFEVNLKPLLMQPPLKGKVILGLDPAYRTGCKIAVIDENGKVLDTAVVYPTPPQNKIEEATAKLTQLIGKWDVDVISIGNGTATKESEIFVANLIKGLNRKVTYAVVNEAGASVYSASKLGAAEFPNFDIALRSAVSIARRLQDPLAELVKIEPKAIGVGQYQHDVNQNQLSKRLDSVVEEAVNQVGVNINTASKSLLTYVSGLNKTIAQNIVDYRNKEGKFTNRNDIKKVSKLGAKTFEQAVGFLRITDGDEPLDKTSIHPESYKAAYKILDLLGAKSSMIGTAELKQRIVEANKEELLEKSGLDKFTFDDILDAFKEPLRDIRDSYDSVQLRSDIKHLEDLKIGDELMGTVRNVVDFGVFVDCGVKYDGLVHLSKMSDKYIKHPSELVSVGDTVKVYVSGVDLVKHKLALSMLKNKI